MKHKHPPHAKRRYQADPMAMFKAFDRVKPLDEEDCTSVVLPVREAFERMRVGNAKDGDFDTMAAALNVALIRAERIDPICVDMVKRSLDALMRTRGRFETHGVWGFDGPALSEIPEAIEFYDQLIELSTPVQMMGAMRETNKRMSKGQTL